MDDKSKLLELLDSKKNVLLMGSSRNRKIQNHERGC